MSDILKKDEAKAVREYVESVNKYNQLLDRYVPVRQVEPGKPIISGEPLTEAALRELEEAEAKVAETQKKWIESIRRLHSER